MYGFSFHCHGALLSFHGGRRARYVLVTGKCHTRSGNESMRLTIGADAICVRWSVHNARVTGVLLFTSGHNSNQAHTLKECLCKDRACCPSIPHGNEEQRAFPMNCIPPFCEGGPMNYGLLCSAMLTAVFAAVVLFLGFVFIAQRKQGEVALLLRSMATSQARTTPMQVVAAPGKLWFAHDGLRVFD